jgi:hypothetical protein
VGTPNRVIRDYRHEPDKALERRKEVIKAERDVPPCPGTNKGVVIPPYYPREPIPAGDPLSPSGTKVELSELADDVLALLVSAASGNRIFNEPLTGVINNANTTFTTINKFVPGTEVVMFNGVIQYEGVQLDYLRSESVPGGGYDTIQFAVAPRDRPPPRSDDSVRIHYNPA